MTLWRSRTKLAGSIILPDCQVLAVVTVVGQGRELLVIMVGDAEIALGRHAPRIQYHLPADVPVEGYGSNPDLPLIITMSVSVIVAVLFRR